MTRAWKGAEFPGIDTKKSSDVRVNIMSETRRSDSCRIWKYSFNLKTSAVNNFIHRRKICSNRQSAKIRLELCLRTFANKRGWVCWMIQTYILIVYAVPVGENSSLCNLF